MDEKRKEQRALLIQWLTLIGTIIALLTALLNFIYASRISHEVKYLSDSSRIISKISEPLPGDPVGGIIYINGINTPDKLFQYVFIVVRNRANPVWEIVDLVQTNSNGKWSGVADVSRNCPIGSDIEIRAIITNRSDAYAVGANLPVPPAPVHGTLSDIVIVRRTK